MAQFARPDSDVTVAQFTPEPLWQQIDEVVRSDADLISSLANQAGLAEVGLSPVTDPEVSTGHIVRYALRRTITNKNYTMVVRLRQVGTATTIAEWTHTNPANTLTGFAQTLTGPQADSITDYADLGLQFDVTVAAGGGGQMEVSWAELEVPDAPAGPQNVSVALINQAASAFTPTVTTGPVTVSVGLINQAAVAFAPTVSLTFNSASDAFNRSATDNPGSADVGGTYEIVEGTTFDFDPNGSRMIVTMPAVWQSKAVRLPAVSMLDGRIKILGQTDKLAVGDYQTVFVRARHAASNTFYEGRVNFNADQTISVSVLRNNAGSLSLIIAPTTVPGTHAAGTDFTVEMDFSGSSPTTIKVRAYLTGGSVPDWQATVNDSTAGALQGAGAVGWGTYLNQNTSNAPVLFSLEDFSAAASGPEVSLGLIDQTAQIHAPTVTPGAVLVSLGLIDSTATTFDPTVTTGAVAISLGLIDQTASTFDPVVTAGAVEISLDLLDATAVVYQPTVSSANAIAVDLLDQAAAAFEPSVASVATIALDLLNQTASLFNPTVSLASATPTLVDSTSATANSTTVAVSVPSGVQVGDLLLLVVCKNHAAGLGTIDALTGWTLEHGLSSGFFAVWTRVADGNEDASYSPSWATSGTVVAFMEAWRGVNTDDPIAAFERIDGSGTSPIGDVLHIGQSGFAAVAITSHGRALMTYSVDNGYAIDETEEIGGGTSNASIRAAAASRAYADANATLQPTFTGTASATWKTVHLILRAEADESVSIRSTQASISGANTNSYTLPTPTYVKDGDKVLALLTITGSFFPTTPDGWTLQGTAYVGSSPYTNRRIAVYMATWSGSLTLTFGYSSNVTRTLGYIVPLGFSSGAVGTESNTQDSNTADAVLPVGAMTLSAQRSFVFAIGFLARGDKTLSGPTGYDLVETNAATFDGDMRTAVSLIWNTVADPAATSFTISSTGFGGITKHMAVGESVAGGSQNVSLGLIDQTATMFAPVVGAGTVVVSLDLIDQTAATFTPTVTTGGVSIDLDLIDQAATAFSPAVTASYALLFGLIDNTATAWDPTVTALYSLAFELIDQEAVAFDPTVEPGGVNVDLGRITQTAATFAPSVEVGAATISLGLLNQTAVAFTPAVTAAGGIALDFLDQTAVAFDPTVSTGEAAIVIGRIEQTAQAFTPTVSGIVSVALGLISNPATALPPSVTTSYEISLERVNNLAAAHAPSVSTANSIELELLDQTAVAHEPTASPGAASISVDRIDQTASTFALTITTGPVEVSFGQISQPAIAFEPTVASIYGISLGRIDNPAEAYEPSIIIDFFLVFDLLDQTAVAFEPTVVGGVGPVPIVFPVDVSISMASKAVGAVMGGDVYVVTIAMESEIIAEVTSE